MADYSTQVADESGTAKRNRAGAAGASGRGRGGGRFKSPELAKALEERHPFWESRRDLWTRLLDLYEDENLARYIHRHPRESKASWENRSKRTERRNYIRAVVSLYRDYIYSKPVTRSPIPRELEEESKALAEQGADPSRVKLLASPYSEEWEVEFLNDVDRGGAPMDRFMGDLSELVFLFGKMYVLVDLPRLPGGVDLRRFSEIERLAYRIRPYCVAYTPLEAVNWDLDEDGKLVWIRFYETPPDTTGPFESRNDRMRRALESGMTGTPPMKGGGGRGAYPRSVAQYRTFTREGWELHRVDGDNVELVDRGRYPEGFRRAPEVPVVSVYNRKGSRYTFGGASLVKGVSTLDQAILNLDSLISEAIYQQTISILVMPRQPVEQTEYVVSESNVLEISPMGFMPFFLTPSQAPLQFMELRIQTLAQEIYRLSKFGGGFGLEPKALAPTTAAYEFNLTNRALAERADNLEAAELEIHRLWFKYFRGQEFRGYVEYPSDFSIQSFMEDLQALTTAKQAIRSPTFGREYEKKIARKILAAEDEQLVSTIEEEIDFVPEITKTFTGNIYDDPLTQESSNPAMGGLPIGALARKMAELRLNPMDLRPNASQRQVEHEREQQLREEQHAQGMQQASEKEKAEKEKAKGQGGGKGETSKAGAGSGNGKTGGSSGGKPSGSRGRRRGRDRK